METFGEHAVGGFRVLGDIIWDIYGIFRGPESDTTCTA
jgi:hypothetical protein